MMTAAQRQLGGLDVLVNNAGGVVKPVYPGASADHWLRMLDLNLRGVMLSTQLAIDAMDTGGAIVNVASTAGLGSDVHGAPEYAAAKAAVMRMTACLAPLRDRRGIPGQLCLPEPDRHPSIATRSGNYGTGGTSRRPTGHARRTGRGRRAAPAH